MVFVELFVWFGRPGGDRLSRTLRCSIIGAGGFHVRVRDGIGCSHSAIATRSSEPNAGPDDMWIGSGGTASDVTIRRHACDAGGGMLGCVCMCAVLVAAVQDGMSPCFGRLAPET